MAYNRLYAARKNNILWGDKPGRLMLKIKKYLTRGTILDAGCGDGKNALYLEKHGYQVIGFDESRQAINGLRNRFARAHWTPRGKYTVQDISTVTISGQYDALVSYGLFHSLPQRKRLTAHRALQRLVKPKGFIFFTCLTDALPIPSRHGTDKMNLPTLKEIKKLFIHWKIKYIKQGIIRENHHPVIGQHRHSAVWIIAQRLK